MTQQQVLEIIRRRMAHVENELTGDPPADPKVWTKAMADYAEEVAHSLTPPVAPAAAASPRSPPRR